MDYLRTVLETALKEYEQQTGISLANHPLAGYLQHCDSVDAVTAVLRNQAQALSGFQGNERMLQPLKGIVTSLFTFSAAAGMNLSFVRPKALNMFNVPDPYPIT